MITGSVSIPYSFLHTCFGYSYPLLSSLYIRVKLSIWMINCKVTLVIGNILLTDYQGLVPKTGARSGIREFPLWLSRVKTWHCLCEDAGLILGLTQWFKDPVGCRCDLASELLWLWPRLALIRPLAWELAYAAGVALKVQSNLHCL